MNSELLFHCLRLRSLPTPFCEFFLVLAIGVKVVNLASEVTVFAYRLGLFILTEALRPQGPFSMLGVSVTTM